MPRRTFELSWLALLVVAATGCGRGGFTPVRGIVKLDGQPLAGASVLFISQDAGGRDARGSTNAEGVFHLTTLQPKDGAAPGNYKVIVQPPTPIRAGRAGTTPQEAQQAANWADPDPSAIPFPARYSQPDQTVLSQVIPASGDVVLELVSK